MKSCWNCVTNKKNIREKSMYHRNSVSMFKASLPQFTMNKYQVWYGLKLNAWLKLFNLFTIFFNFPSRSFCFLPKKKMSSDDYWVENMLRKLKGFLKFSSISKVGGYPGLFPILILNLTSYGLINIQRCRKDSKSDWATCKN